MYKKTIFTTKIHNKIVQIMEDNQAPVLELENKPELSQAFVNSMTQKSSVFDAPRPKEFVVEPFFKDPEPKEEAKPEEKVEGKAEEKVEGEAKIEAKPEGTKVEAQAKVEDKPVEVKPAEVEQPKELSENEILGLVNKALGNKEYNLSSVQDIKSFIEENKKYKEIQNQLAELTQEERARIEIGREHGDFGLYDRIISINADQLSDKEAIRQKFMLENFGKSPQLLEKQFEKHFAKTYEEDPDEEYTKLLLKDNANESRNDIRQLQADFKKRGQISGQADPAIAKQKKQEEDRLWMEGVDKVLNSTDRVTYDLEGSKINIVMDVKDKAVLQNAMDNPIDYLKTQITNQDGTFNHSKLHEHIMFDMYKAKALKEAYELGATRREEEILKQKKGKVEVPATPAGDAGVKVDMRDKIAEGIRSFGIR